jgi:hypothetical protein
MSKDLKYIDKIAQKTFDDFAIKSSGSSWESFEQNLTDSNLSIPQGGASGAGQIASNISFFVSSNLYFIISATVATILGVSLYMMNPVPSNADDTSNDIIELPNEETKEDAVDNDNLEDEKSSSTAFPVNSEKKSTNNFSYQPNNNEKEEQKITAPNATKNTETKAEDNTEQRQTILKKKKIVKTIVDTVKKVTIVKKRIIVKDTIKKSEK